MYGDGGPAARNWFGINRQLCIYIITHRADGHTDRPTVADKNLVDVVVGVPPPSPVPESKSPAGHVYEFDAETSTHSYCACV